MLGLGIPFAQSAVTLNEVRWNPHALGSPFPWMAVQFSGSSLYQALDDWRNATSSPSPSYYAFGYLGAVFLHIPLSCNQKRGRVIAEMTVGISLGPAFL